MNVHVYMHIPYGPKYWISGVIFGGFGIFPPMTGGFNLAESQCMLGISVCEHTHGISVCEHTHGISVCEHTHWRNLIWRSSRTTSNLPN